MKATTLTWVATFTLLLAGCEKARLDEQVKELCAKDGGIKVYEAVKLPADRFDQWGMVKPYDPTKGENTLGPDYIFKREIHYYRQGNPEMSREHYRVIRRSDGKLLSETILYGRGGGDMPGPWHDSSFSCPKLLEAGPNMLLKSTFFPMNKE
jgi:hypothetical protein